MNDTDSRVSFTENTKPVLSGGAKRLSNIRRIRNWENFFLDSAVYSVGVALGVEFEDGFTPISAVTGDMFTYMYSDIKPCDSGLTNYVFMPEVITDAFALFGAGCRYLSNAEIKADFGEALRLIRDSVDRGIPVLAWGIGDVPFKDGEKCVPLPEGCFIGGYDETEKLLFANVYPEAERIADTSAKGLPGVDEFGYTALDEKRALDSTNGLFFVTDKIEPPEPKEVYRRALLSVPRWLTLPEADGYVYGKAAFDKWASVLLDDEVWATVQLCEDRWWDKHCCAYCSICTSIGVGDGSRTLNFIEKAFKELPDFPNAEKITECYRRMFELTNKIWNIHGGFNPPADKLVNREYRETIAGCLTELGKLCAELLACFD